MPDSAAVSPLPESPSARRVAPPLLWTLAIAALAAALSAWAWSRLSPDARIPIHWNAAGRVDGYGHRNMLFVQPLVILGLGLLLDFLPLIEPRRGREIRATRAYRAIWLGLLLFMFALHVMIVRAAFAPGPLSLHGIFFGAGALFAVIGNFLGKIRSNFLVGVRTPWTLSSELSWNKTHRLAGWLFVTGGLALMLGSVCIADTRPLVGLLVAWLAVTLVILVVYSYRVWRADPQKLPRR